MLTLLVLALLTVGSLILNFIAIHNSDVQDELDMRIASETRTLGEMLGIAYFVPGALIIITILLAVREIDRKEFVRYVKDAFVAIVKPPHG